MLGFTLFHPTYASLKSPNALKIFVSTGRSLVMALLDTLQENRSQILAIAARHGAFNVRVFGSVVRGEETPESDIDFLIDYDLEQITPWFPVGLIHDLQDLLGREVDVVPAKSLHYYIKDRVLVEAKPL
jgi:uncharacterized protein